MSDTSDVIQARALLRNGTGKAIRERAGLTMTELGASMEPPVPASTILRWERGRSRPRAKTAQAYLTALKRVKKATASVDAITA